MKTIAEIVKENEPWTKHIVAALEAREKERDAERDAQENLRRETEAEQYSDVLNDLRAEIAKLKRELAEYKAGEELRKHAERKRVIAAFKNADGLPAGWSLVLAQLYYPPPKPETLPAGWYFERYNDGETLGDWGTLHYASEFQPELNHQYCQFDPPPEVTGKADIEAMLDAVKADPLSEEQVERIMRNAKAEPSAMEKSCCDKNADFKACDCPKADPTLPTFEEWCEANGVRTDTEYAWWSWGYINNSHGRNLPKDLFVSLEGGIHKFQSGGTWQSRQYGGPTDATTALKAALLKLGRIRE